MVQRNDYLNIKETTQADLPMILNLWADGEVMQYVGFPEGLKVNLTILENWHQKISQKPYCKHYSIYDAELGFCGETFYEIDTEHGISALDIKLFSHARGKGIAEAALKYVLNEVFETDICTRAYVEPQATNLKAWQLYEKVGFSAKPRPTFLEPNEVYLEIDKETWMKRYEAAPK